MHSELFNLIRSNLILSHQSDKLAEYDQELASGAGPALVCLPLFLSSAIAMQLPLSAKLCTGRISRKSTAIIEPSSCYSHRLSALPSLSWETNAIMGRRPNQVIQQYFQRGPKLADNSNRYVNPPLSLNMFLHWGIIYHGVRAVCPQASSQAVGISILLTINCTGILRHASFAARTSPRAESIVLPPI